MKDGAESTAGESRRDSSYRTLLSPLTLKHRTLRNRIVKSSTVLGFAAEDGNAGQMLIDWYEALARGGAGMVIAESSCVDYPLGGKGENRLRIDDDAYIASFSRLADAIHRHGSATILQLTHNGPAGKFSGQPPVAASELPQSEVPLSDPRVKYDPARAMTQADIDRTIEKHAAAAWRARQAGFDGVEVHAGHSYLINSFLSRAWNRRDDDYGAQSLGNRARLGVEIIRAIRSRVGSDFILGMRVNGQEWGHPQGTLPEETAEFARRFEAAGLDLIHVTGWGYGDGAYSWVQYPEQLLYPEPAVPEADLVRRPGTLASRAAIVKRAVSIPVMAVGSLNVRLGEWLLARGMADLVAMGRALMADPDLPRKLAQGREEDIRPCMRCLECRTPFQRYRPASCRVNAGLGKEAAYRIVKTPAPKHVIVVGGGPAGMEAARVAAARGHRVRLFEQHRMLGGSLHLAALIKGSHIEDFPGLVAYYETQLSRLGVDVVLGKRFDADLAGELRPDVAILATGGKAVTPAVPGIEHAMVHTGERLQQLALPFLRWLGAKRLEAVSKLWLPVGRKVVILGGMLHGCQVAAFLVKRGREVTIVEASSDIGGGIPIALKPRLIDWLRSKGTEILGESTCESIAAREVRVRLADGSARAIPADSVICALPPIADDTLERAVAPHVGAVHRVGDCGDSKLILGAIASAARVAHAL